jgi:hypothetical protein
MQSLGVCICDARNVLQLRDGGTTFNSMVFQLAGSGTWRVPDDSGRSNYPCQNVELRGSETFRRLEDAGVRGNRQMTLGKNVLASPAALEHSYARNTFALCWRHFLPGRVARPEDDRKTQPALSRYATRRLEPLKRSYPNASFCGGAVWQRSGRPGSAPGF